MCGRYRLKAERERIIEKFRLKENLSVFDSYEPRSEIFPGTNILGINNRFEPEEIWWTIYGKTWEGKPVAAINAKAENVLKAQMFKSAFQNDRILIPATSLYEWQVQPDKSKVKYEISFDEELFAFAGLATDSIHKDVVKRSCAIITTEANSIFQMIHNAKQRQAVVIREGDYETWLNPDTPYEVLKNLMRPLPDEATSYREAE